MHSATPPGANTPASYWPLIDNAHDIFGGHHGSVTGATVVAHAGANLYVEAGSGGGPSPLLTVLGPSGGFRGD